MALHFISPLLTHNHFDFPIHWHLLVYFSNEYGPVSSKKEEKTIKTTKQHVTTKRIGLAAKPDCAALSLPVDHKSQP